MLTDPVIFPANERPASARSGAMPAGIREPSAPGGGMLVLEDGSVFVGDSVGAEGEFVGEVVFNTSMAGYQEVLSDPSYSGQMVVFTCPHIGNVGVNDDDRESCRPQVRAVLARQITDVPSSWRAEAPLCEWLAAHGIPALSGVDTRALTLVLRDRGVMRGALSTVRPAAERLLAMALSAPDMSDLAPVEQVAVRSMGRWGEALPARWAPRVAPGPDGLRRRTPHIVVLDCGSKHQILRELLTLGAEVTVVPPRLTAAELLAMRPDGVLIGNGPGDPHQVPAAVEAARGLLGRVPLFGICLGHQIIALAAGARIFKLPFGHHGGNHPVRIVATDRVEITAQNHNYCVVEASLSGLPLEVSRVSLFDGTVEGLRHRDLAVWSVQYHPEASPGPHDALHELQEFVEAARGE